MAGFHLVTGQFQLLADVILDVIHGSLLGGNAQNSSLQGRWTSLLNTRLFEVKPIVLWVDVL
jgi:hypothetical protein